VKAVDQATDFTVHLSKGPNKVNTIRSPPNNRALVLVLELQKPLLVELRYLVWTPQLQRCWELRLMAGGKV
jgi:hypothetical protein